MKWAFSVVALVALAAIASAQTPVVNPTTVIFDHTDFASTDSYSIGYFTSATATAPLQEETFPKPATCAPCSGPLPSSPAAFQTWYVGARAIANGVSSAWSSPLVPFVHAPAAPTNVRLQ